MGKFAFAGRKREKARVWKLIKKSFGDFAPDMKKFLDEQYDESVPYHGPVHVLYGLAYLVGNGFARNSVENVILYWLGHDAGHNGVAAESPEEKSADIFTESNLFIERHRTSVHANMANACILGTKFPYPLDDRMVRLNEYYQLRMLDTLRVASGATAPFLGLESAPDPFLVCMYESCGLWLELGIEPEIWLRKGQLGFFFPHLRDCLANGRVFGRLRDHVDQPHDLDFAVAIWKNHQRLYEIMMNDAKKTSFLALINWAVGNDCTLPEFVAMAKGL